MKTIIRTRNQLETVTDHRESIPVKSNRSVDYGKYVERIERAYSDRTERRLMRDLTEIF